MFEATIGIEIHAELKSNNKVFSNSLNRFNVMPNKYVSVIDLGYPGTLPILNEEVVDMALKAVLAFNCKINKEMHFDRKNYFYPDLPKGYQITQNKTPIGYDGYVEIEKDGIIKKIGIARIHIEEDTCKSIHDDSSTLLNYNRAGVPLIEIVTTPTISDSKEAYLYAEKIRETLLYLGVSDAKMEEGSMRCEANVSLKEVGSNILGTKVEIKNIGSINNMASSIDYEIKRQTELLTNGEKIEHETRRFDEGTKTTVLMRKKESGNDYRYFPEPDLPYLILTDEKINNIKLNLPTLPDAIRRKYKGLGLNDNNIKTIIGNTDLYHFFESVINDIDPVTGANILTTEIISYLNKNKKELSDLNLTKEDFIIIVQNRYENKITSRQVKEIVESVINNNSNVQKLINEMSSNTLSNVDEIEKIIKEVITDNEESVNDYKNGSDRAIKFLMGQVMKKTGGRIDPKKASEVLLDLLSY